MKKHTKLDDIDPESPFKVPGGYFNELPEKVIKRCRREERNRSFIRIFKPAVSLAALFIGIALIAYFAVEITERPDQNNSYKQEDIAEAEYNRQFSNEKKLIEAFKDSQKESNKQKTDRYIDYLLEENIDYGTLIKELEKEQNDRQNE
ncbi:MAG: hypothetical protein ACLFM7_03040 [Bacteroidales bacterium]